MDPVGVAPLGKSLPPGWSIRRTSSGRLFYVNHKSKTTQWNSPDNSQAGEVEEESKNVEEALPKYDLKEFDLPEVGKAFPHWFSPTFVCQLFILLGMVHGVPERQAVFRQLRLLCSLQKRVCVSVCARQREFGRP